jgi:tetratricopeptide repeat protein 30
MTTRLPTGRLLTSSGAGYPFAGMMRGFRPPQTIQDGQYTSTIYGLLAKGKYEDAKTIILNQLEHFPNSRAALSLLAYCQFMLEDYINAAQR